jgi:hypothetical protein
MRWFEVEERVVERKEWWLCNEFSSGKECRD